MEMFENQLYVVGASYGVPLLFLIAVFWDVWIFSPILIEFQKPNVQ